MKSSNAINSYRFITFRASPDNPSFLTNFLDILLPKVRLKCPEYAVGIEKDGTPDRHVHMVIGHPSFNDTQKFNKFIFFKEMELFKNAIKDWSTVWQHAYCPKEVHKRQEDILKVVGYTLKEEHTNKETKGFTENFILDSKDFYLAHGRIKNQTPSHLIDWKQLNKKNLANNILDFCHKNNTTISDPLLIFKMREARYDFSDLTSKAQKEIIDNIRIVKKDYSEIPLEKLQEQCILKLDDGTFEAKDGNLQVDLYNHYKWGYIIENNNLRKEIIKLKEEIKKLQPNRKAKPVDGFSDID